VYSKDSFDAEGNTFYHQVLLNSSYNYVFFIGDGPVGFSEFDIYFHSATDAYEDRYVFNLGSIPEGIYIGYINVSSDGYYNITIHTDYEGLLSIGLSGIGILKIPEITPWMAYFSFNWDFEFAYMNIVKLKINETDEYTTKYLGNVYDGSNLHFANESLLDHGIHLGDQYPVFGDQQTLSIGEYILFRRDSGTIGIYPVIETNGGNHIDGFLFLPIISLVTIVSFIYISIKRKNLKIE